MGCTWGEKRIMSHSGHIGASGWPGIVPDESQNDCMFRILKELKEITLQLVVVREQLQILSTRLVLLEERQKEVETYMPVDPFATMNSKRTRKIKRIAQ